ncbi:integral membrane protein S linking to the trans Golgi network-domain-containing protein [Cryomyces antarcticus]
MPRRRRPPRPGALADLSPLRILTQIIILQVLYYACAAVLILFTALVAGKDVSLDLLLSWRPLRGDVTVGWMLGLCWMMDSLICVIFLLLLVARSKLIPDFALTIHLLHLLTTSLYSRGLPAHAFWWALQLASAGLMTWLGVWSCRWRELRPISFDGERGAGGEDGERDRDADEGAGYGRGRGKGKARSGDGMGAYEMVGMGERA